MSEHGTRTHYVKGCRCEPCTAANREYARNRDRHLARVRYGIEQPVQKFVDATEARKHLQWLRTQHIGLRTISAATGIGRSALQDIASGVTSNVLLATELAILAVGRTGLACYVPAGPTWELIDDLLYLGYPKARIAEALGHRCRAVQIGRNVIRPATAARVRRVWFDLVRTHAPWHGTLQGYRRHGCRCIQCRRSETGRVNAYRDRRAAA